MRLAIHSAKAKEIIDITDLVNRHLNGKGEGLCHLLLLHTTAALTTADLDPGTDEDMLDAFKAIVPKLGFRHAHNPSHTPDHILSSLIGTSLLLPHKDGALILGGWQRLILVELDGPRQREIELSLVKRENP